MFKKIVVKQKKFFFCFHFTRKETNMKNITIMGGGVLGSQIAFQAAYCGFDVTIWLRSEGSIGRTQPKLDSIKQSYIDALISWILINLSIHGVWVLQAMMILIKRTA